MDSSTAFYWIRALFGSQLESAAMQLHGIALTLLALAWLSPWVRAMFHRLPASSPDVEWVQLWRCPECSTYNRRATPSCTHCGYHLSTGGWTRRVPLRVSEFIRENAKRFTRLYRLAGWILFYGGTAAAVGGLTLYTFRQEAMRELLASIVLLLLLLAFMLFRQALMPRLKSPLRILLDLIAGSFITIIMLSTLFLWAQAAGERGLARNLYSAYSLSLGRLHFLQNRPSAFDGPTPPAAKKISSPQKAARRKL
jgi:hypothetical protein